MAETEEFGKSLSFACDRGECEDAQIISAALGREIAERFGPADAAPLSLRAYEGERLTGGLNGLIHWRWLYIRHFWIDTRWRGRGLGRQLLAQAEAEMTARDGAGIYLDTFDAGAAAFYERCGFIRCGEIANFPPGFSRVFLRKGLAAG